MTAIGRGRNHHGQALLRGSLLVTLPGQGGEGGAMQSPIGLRALVVFCLAASNRNTAKGVQLMQGVIACTNPTWGLLLVRVELLGSRPYQGAP